MKKVLYIDCNMGAAGDMLTAALLELLPDKEEAVNELNAIGIPGVTFTVEESVKCGITGTHVTVKVNGEEEECCDEHFEGHTHSHETHSHCHGEHGHDHEHHHDHEHSHDHHHHHSGMHEIEHIIEGLNVSESVKANALNVYKLIAEAESHVHGVPVTEIHFHEVGTMDAVADITAFCMLMERIAPDEVIVSPVHVGSGQVRCAHGILPVPAPATAHILKGIPVYGGKVRGELCTPTGAALLKTFATRFGDMPVMAIENTGYGMGKKDFEAANCVRVILGEKAGSNETQGCNETPGCNKTPGSNETVTELSCNIDDMTAEELGYAEEELLKAGALDVYTIPIQMKKSRPGHMLSVMCRDEDKERMVNLIFLNTSTIGIRENTFKRYTLTRRTETVSTVYGDVRKKVSEGYGVRREKYEYDDIARIAMENEISLRDVIKNI
ncbi:MAG: nickel pincer cofactor biosynthesis protein LarC [Eubacteriales bacterium]|nr:nickel pincer cofactor biosynthesis protein LarC [Eubacteriales bacterium]